MAKITTYDSLVALAETLKAGDTITIGTDDVSPTLITAFTDLSLDAPFTVATSVVNDEPPSISVTCTADLFGLTSLDTTLTFTPEDAPTGPFLLAIRTAAAAGSEWTLLAGFTLMDPALSFNSSGEIEVLLASVDCNVVVGAGDPLTLPITMTVPTYSGQDWVLAGEFTDQPLTADAFSALVGGMKLSEYLPSGLASLAKLRMTELEVGYNPTSGGLSYAFMEIAHTDAWTPFSFIHVPAGGVSLKFRVDFVETDQSYIELDAKFDIATVPVDIGAHFSPNNFYVWGKLQDGRSVALNDVFKHFDVTMPERFPAVRIDKLSLLAGISTGDHRFDLVAQIDAGSELKVNDLTANVSVSTTPDTRVDADFHATISVGEAARLFLQAKYDGGGGGLTLVGKATEIPMNQIIAYFARQFGINEDQIPEPIRTLVLKSIDTSYNTASGDFTFKCVGDFTLYDTPVEVMFQVNIIHPTSPRALTLPEDAVTGSSGYSATFGGSVEFAGNLFEVRFNTKDTGQKTFVADYQHVGEGGAVRIRDLVASVSQALAGPIPSDIAINLKVIKFAYLSAVPEGGGDATNHFLFGVELGARIGLSDIPLIGDKLPADLTVEFQDLQFAYAKPGFDKAQAALVNAVLPKGIGPIPDDGLKEGVLIASSLQLGDTTHPIELQIPTGGDLLPRQLHPAPALAGTLQAPVTGAAPSGHGLELVVADSATPGVAMSINIQRQFGPLTIRKLGLAYEDQRLFVTGDISLSAEVLSVGILGLGIGSKVNEFDPAVRLSGLSITVAAGPISVSGGLYGSISPLNFNGALQVTMPSLQLGALGGYAQLGSDPSFFMYVAVNQPLFGYPFFFVNGLAGGLGFNRDLMIPDIDGVASFPLVAWATGREPPGNDPNGDIGQQVQDVLAALEKEIPPRVGQYWVAAGISFSSFNVLQSFALVTVVFGTDFKVALLGLTTASLPPNSGAGVEPIGHIEMALRASFSPQAGILEIEARLTDASYILTKACKITGGFAYYMWFKDNPTNDPAGYHAGDFVVTLGGYNAAYKAPAYFPTVPRLGFNWKVDPHTTIKGGIYFAVTPTAIMAGGALEAVWQSGDLKAWFTAHADFLLSWKPFHYEASIGLTIGASYKLNLLFTSVTLSVHIGVELSLWGPPFGGEIHVDLMVISFTVGIGNTTKPKASAISWADFKASFLPDQGAGHARALEAGTTVPTDSYCLSSVAGGLVRDLTGAQRGDGLDWVVNAEGLEIVTMSVLPSKTATLTTAGRRTSALPVGATEFGVGPAAVSVSDFTSCHAITINRIVDGAPDPSFDVTEHATIGLSTSNLPNGTWGGKLMVNPSIGEINRTPANIPDLAVGYRIKAKPGRPDHTPLPIDISILQQENEGTVGFDWLRPVIPTTDSYDQTRAMQTLQTTLIASAAKRAAIIAALNGPGLDLGVDADVDVDELARSANTVLLHAPVLSHLGEERVEAAK